MHRWSAVSSRLTILMWLLDFLFFENNLVACVLGALARGFVEGAVGGH